MSDVQDGDFELMRAGGSRFRAWPGVVGAHLRGEHADVVAYWFTAGHEAPEDRVSRDVVAGFWVGTQGERVVEASADMSDALVCADLRWLRAIRSLEDRRMAVEVAQRRLCQRREESRVLREEREAGAVREMAPLVRWSESTTEALSAADKVMRRREREAEEVGNG